MKRIPKVIRIGCHDYEVVTRKVIEAPDGTHCNAYIEKDVLKIFVESGLKRQKKQEVLLHEAIHGAFDGYPLPDEDEEEQIVSYFAPRLLQLIKDNPDLVEYLRSR